MLCKYDVIEMEYLKEYEEDLFLKVVPSTSHSDSNNCNMLVPKKSNYKQRFQWIIKWKGEWNMKQWYRC